MTDLTKEQIREQLDRITDPEDKRRFTQAIKERMASGEISIVFSGAAETSPNAPRQIRKETVFGDVIPKPVAELDKGIGFLDILSGIGWGGQSPTGRAQAAQEFVDVTGRNLPFSLAEIVREAEGVLQNPRGTAEAALRLGRGLGGKQFDPTSEDDQTALQFIEGIAESVGSPQEISRHPLGAASTVADLVLPFKPKSSILRAVADPIAGTARATAATAKAAGVPVVKATAKLSTLPPAFASGAGPRAVQDIAAAGFESKITAQKARKQMGFSRIDEDIGRDILNAIDAERKSLGKAKGDVIRAADEAGITVSAGPLRRDVFKALTEDPFFFEITRTKSGKLNIELPTSITRKNDRRLIKSAIEDLDNLGLNPTAREMDNFKTKMDNIQTRDDFAGLSIGEMRKRARESLSDVPGYDEALVPLKEFNDFLDSQQERLGVGPLRQKGRKKPNASRLGRGVDRAFNRGGESTSRAINELDARFPELNLRSMAAGERFTELDPSGIAGRTQAANVARQAVQAGAMGGAGIAGAAVGGIALGIPVAVASLIFFSPRVIGEVALAMGSSARQAKKIVSALEKAQKKARDLGITDTALRSMTVGELLQRTGVVVEEDDEQRTPIQSFLGRIGSGDTTLIGSRLER
jgi:hypothetical protein